VVLGGGGIVEQGTHNELMANGSWLAADDDGCSGGGGSGDGGESCGRGGGRGGAAAANVLTYRDLVAMQLK